MVVNFVLKHSYLKYRHCVLVLVTKSFEGFSEVPDIVKNIACFLGLNRFSDFQILQVKMWRLHAEHLRN